MAEPPWCSVHGGPASIDSASGGPPGARSLAPRLCVLPFRAVCSEHGQALARQSPRAAIEQIRCHAEIASRTVSLMAATWEVARESGCGGTRAVHEARWTLHGGTA